VGPLQHTKRRLPASYGLGRQLSARSNTGIEGGPGGRGALGGAVMQSVPELWPVASCQYLEPLVSPELHRHVARFGCTRHEAREAPPLLISQVTGHQSDT
jgi:hypothetical protein